MNRLPDTPGARKSPALGLLSVLLVVGLACGCMGPHPGDRDGRRSARWIEMWVAVVQDSAGTVRPCVRVAVPHHALVFRREADHYIAGLELDVVALRDGAPAGGGVGGVRVRLEEYAATRTGTTVEASAPVTLRGQGSVSLEVTVRVDGTGRAWERQLSFDPRSLAAMPVWIDAVRTGLVVGPYGDLELPADADTLRLQATLRRHAGAAAWPSSGVDLVTELSGSALERTRRRRAAIPTVAMDGDSTLVDQVWPADRLPFGRCRLEVSLEIREDGEVVKLPRDPAIDLVNLRVPVADDHAWGRHVVWLDGALPSSSRDTLRALPAGQRPDAWRAVWRRVGRRDDMAPDAARHRHLRRIVDADDRFGGFGRGALSDRGRMFIRWGEPARIETYADGRTPGSVWEVWIYPERGRRVFFHDAHGMGDFRLRREEPMSG